jgi:tRNA A37 N6-isopentenylltransferase MiaA
MKHKLIIIIGPTCTNKSNIALSYCNKYDSILFPIDQLHLYKHLQYGTNLNLSKLSSVRSLGYQMLSPWTIFKPTIYVKWLIHNINVLIKYSDVVIEGGCTSYISQLINYLNQNHISEAVEIYCLDRCNKSINRAIRRCTIDRIKKIITETKTALKMGFIRESSEIFFSQCEKLYKHPEFKNDDLAWAFRISAKSYFPAFLNLKGVLNFEDTRSRIINNLLDIQNYQSERLTSILGRDLFITFEEAYDKLQI